MNDQLTDLLSGLSLEQLQALQEKLASKAAAKTQRAKKTGLLPPIPSGDVSKMADALGLDISSLMRDVKRRS